MLKSKWIFLTLCVVFMAYSFSVYFSDDSPGSLGSDHAKISEGKLIWQKYNCQACHQIYGLGGYLGPDLTNLFSRPGKDRRYFHAILRAGTKQMPVFNLTEHEESILVAYLQAIDKSGKADPRLFETSVYGMTEQP